MASAVNPPYNALGDIASITEYRDATMPFLEVKGADYKARFVTFTNIIFDSLVHFEETDFSIGLIFNNCTFNEPLVFKNVKASGHDPVLNPDSQNLVFKKCGFKSRVLFEGKKNSIERSLHFENCTFDEGLEIEALNIEVESLVIKKCTIHKKLDLFNITAKQDLRFSGNSMDCFVRIERLSASYLALTEDNVFNEDFHIRDSKFEQGIVFNNGTFKREIHFTLNTTVKSGLTIIGSVFEKAFFVNFHSGKLKPQRGFYTFYLSSAKFNNGIYVDGKEDLFADDPFVEEITLNITSDLKGNIVFRNLHLGILDMNGYNTSANILFEHLFINQIRIKALINNAGLVFSGIKASHETWYRKENPAIPRENALYIDDSNFGKAQFYQVDFSSFKSVVFHNNILTEISTSLVKWFTPDQLKSKFEEDDLHRLKQAKKAKSFIQIQNAINSLISTYRSRQEIYRQLKFASQKQGDIPQSLEFQRHEMNYYRKVVTIREPRKWSEFFILWTNQTNDFGQDWIKALKLLILFTFIGYVPIGFLTSENLDYSHFATSYSDILVNFRVIFWDNIKSWLVVLNPTHRMSDISEKIENYSSWVYFWDFLSRIIASYFIFQTISAFRKFNK